MSEIIKKRPRPATRRRELSIELESEEDLAKKEDDDLPFVK